MRKQKIVSHNTFLPSPPKYARGSALLLAALSMFLIAMSQTGNMQLERFKHSVNDTAVPVLAVLGKPFAAVQSAAEWGAEMVALRQENIRLKNENIQLLKWQAAARELEVENHSLRAVLNTVPAQSQHYVTANIVSDTGGPYMHAALLNAGSLAGVEHDQPIIAAQGLLGRVVESGEKSARVLFLTDMNSRIPVMLETSREKSILSGNGTALPTLAYIAAGSNVQAGERVVTSGDGGVFPSGIPVGEVVVGDEGTPMVRLFARPADTSFVRAVDFKR